MLSRDEAEAVLRCGACSSTTCANAHDARWRVTGGLGRSAEVLLIEMPHPRWRDPRRRHRLAAGSGSGSGSGLGSGSGSGSWGGMGAAVAAPSRFRIVTGGAKTGDALRMLRIEGTPDYTPTNGSNGSAAAVDWTNTTNGSTPLVHVLDRARPAQTKQPFFRVPLCSAHS